MYNFLIVDDEYLIRQAISAKIKFLEFPYTNIFFADNAYDALDIVETQHIDIMLIDIRMPGMDGLILIKKAKSLNSIIHFVVISGYADFDYAQDALQSGVEAYLLKPIDDDQFILTLNRLKDKIDSHSRTQLRVNEMELNNQVLAMERNLNLLLHAIPKNSESDDRKGIDIFPHWENGFFQLMMIRMENRTIDDEKKFIMIRRQIVKLFSDKISFSKDCTIIDDYMRLNNVMIIFHGTDQAHITSSVDVVLRLLTELINGYKEIVIGMSAIHNSLNKLLYSESLWACDLRLIYSERSYFVYKPDVEMKSLPNDYYDDFKDLLKTKELQFFETRIRELLNPDSMITMMHGNTREVVRILLSLISQEKEVNDSIQRLSADELIENARNIEDIVTSLYNYSESVFPKDSVISQNCRDIIEKVERYILIHYKKKLILRELAIMYNMNSNYMSSIFKKVFGKGFTDYLTQVRLKHACDMLLNTKMSINEIAQEVGFENSSYFYRVFKNTFGITALKYRNRRENKAFM